MPDLDDPHAYPQGAGFVTFPAALIAHPDLTDCDVRVLLMLDQIGWREGDRDGFVTASNEEIGRRLGKSASTVKSSLKRIEAVRPLLVRRLHINSNCRDSIQLCYDRFGSAKTVASVAEVVPATTGVVKILATPVSSYQKTDESVSTGGDEAGVVKILTTASAVKILTTLPIRELHHQQHQLGGSDYAGVVKILATPADSAPADEPSPAGPSAPSTIPALLDWLPSIASGDARLLERLTVKVPLLVERVQLRRPEFASVAIDWVQDALLDACDKEDPVSYAARVLKGYVEDGGRPGIEIPRVVATPEPDAPTLPMPRPARPGGFAPPTTRAQRNAADSARRKESLSTMFKPREADDAAR